MTDLSSLPIEYQQRYFHEVALDRAIKYALEDTLRLARKRFDADYAYDCLHGLLYDMHRAQRHSYGMEHGGQYGQQASS